MAIHAVLIGADESSSHYSTIQEAIQQAGLDSQSVELGALSEHAAVEVDSIAVLVCWLSAEKRAIPDEILQVLQQTGQYPPPLLIVSAAETQEPATKLYNEQIIVCGEQIAARDIANITQQLVYRHPQVVDLSGEQGVQQRDATSLNQVDHQWLASCRRGINENDAWPWIHRAHEHQVQCGIYHEPTQPDQPIPDGAVTVCSYNSEDQTIEVGDIPDGYQCWIVNTNRWPTVCQVSSGQAARRSAPGDHIIVSNRLDIESALKSARPAQRPAIIRQLCLEQQGVSIMLEVR